jgi:hypothetical protein
MEYGERLYQNITGTGDITSVLFGKRQARPCKGSSLLSPDPDELYLETHHPVRERI